MMVARFYRSITWAALAFERGFPAITPDVHFQDRGVVHEPVDSRQRHGDLAMTVAAIDRLVHHATVLELNTESYRRRAALRKSTKAEAG